MKRKIKKFVFVLVVGILFLFGFSFQETFAIFGIGPDIPSTDDVKSDMANDTPFPKVWFEIVPSPGFIQPGQEVSLIARHEGFSLSEADAEKLSFNWCVDNLPLSAKIAGSQDRIKQDNDGNLYLEGRYGKVEGGKGACLLYKNPDWVGGINFIPEVEKKSMPDDFIIERKFDSPDSDKDGLPDNWEIRYFAGRRKPGTNDFYPTADEKSALLTAVKPDDDPDKDGWKYPAVDLTGMVGLSTVVAPYENGSWTIGVPQVKGNKIGDKKFTNLEEFVFGTDPLNSDTDGDGVKDEADVAGVKQSQISIRVNKKAGEKYAFILYAFGITQRYRIDESPFRRAEKYYRADFPNTRKWVKGEKITPEGKNIIQVGQGLPLQIEFGYTPYPTPFDTEEITMKALVKSLSVSDESINFFYKWFLDGKPQASKEKTPQGEIVSGEGENKSGFNKNVFKFKPSKKACESYLVGLEIINLDTKQTAYQEVEVPLTASLDFKKKVIGNTDLHTEKTSYFNLKEGAGVSVKELLLSAEDKFKEEINKASEQKEERGFRKGDVIEVSINEEKFENSLGLCPGNKDFKKYLESLTYNWKFNGISQNWQSGKGIKFSSAYFILRSEPRMEYKGGNDPSSLIEVANNDTIRLEIIDENGKLIAARTEAFKIIPPYIKWEVKEKKGKRISPEPPKGEKEEKCDEQGCSEPDVPIYYVKPGTQLIITAKLHHFRPSKPLEEEGGFRYKWRRNGIDIKPESEPTEAVESSIEIKVGEQNEKKIENEKIELVVENIVDQIESGITPDKEKAESSIVITTKEPSAEKKETKSGPVASLEKFIPNYFKNIFNLAITSGILFLVALLGISLGGTSRGKM